MAIVDVKDTIYHLEYEVAKIKLVNQEYPNFKLKYDARSGTYEYFSPKVKYSFNDIETVINSYYISIKLSRKLDFVFEEESETITIHNSPLEYHIGSIYLKSFVFYEKPFVCRDKILKKKVQDAIDMAIINFIKNNPGNSLDKSQLSPRLQKLLILT